MLFASLLPLKAEPHIMIGSLKFVRISTEDTPNAVREYVREGDSVEHWNRLASVRVLSDQKDPNKCLAAVAGMVKNSVPNAKYQFFQDKKSKKITSDFIVFFPPKVPQRYAEWNLVHAEYKKGTGLICVSICDAYVQDGCRGEN